MMDITKTGFTFVRKYIFKANFEDEFNNEGGRENLSFSELLLKR